MTAANAKLSANSAAGNLAGRLAAVRARIAAAAERCGRRPQTVELLPVSKGQPLEALRAAHALGLRAFGENYLQEALDKMDSLPADCCWHFIGAIQSNKTRPIATHFDWVHTVDRPQIARRLSAQRPPERGPLMICVQVRLSDEPGKSGVDPADAAALCAQVAELPRLQLRGLMAIPAPSSDPARQFADFDRLRELRDRIDPGMDTLSMGMSNDLEAAVQAGSTCLRIGTALFGPRPQRNQP